MRKIVVIFLFFTKCVPNKNVLSTNRSNYVNYLTNNNQCYWDPYYTYSNNIIGTGWFFISEKQMIEYNYNRVSQKTFRDYGDIIKDTMNWSMKEDTLIIDEFYKYKILKTRNDTLEVEDCLKLSGKKKILFVKSKDQITPIIKNKFKYLDSADLKIRVMPK